MTKEEAVKKLAKVAGLSVPYAEDLYDSIVPKPVVPQYIADMIVERKKQKYGIVGTIQSLGGVFNNPFNWIIENQEDFVKAWLYGYEVEKEKLYTVEIPNPNSKGNKKICLCKDDTTGKVYLCKGKFNYSKNRNLRFTEEEIRKDFDWAWQFAKEVE